METPSYIRVANSLSSGEQIGWCISGVAWRQTKDDIVVWTRPFTVGKQYSQEEAEQYALTELAELWEPSMGWRYVAIAMPIRLTDE